MLRSIQKSDPQRRSLGIDIGLHSIKTVLLERTREGPAVRHAARVPMPSGSVEKGVLTARRDVAARLRQIVRRLEVPITRASFSVPIEHLLVRWIELPRMDDDALRAATRFEARKYLPYPIEKAEVVLTPMEAVGEGEDERMRVLLSAAPRDVVHSRAEALEAAGLEVAVAELEPICILRALHAQNRRHGMLWRGQPITYIQLGEEASGICVVQDMHLRFVRAISWGSNRLTQALAQSLDCAPEEARAIKEQSDATLDEDGIFSWNEAGERQETNALMPELDRLCREIQRLLHYYRSLFPERSYEGILDRIVLCGGTADLDGLPRYFARTLQVDVSVRNPFQSIASRLSSASFETIKGHETGFVVAIGLALGELQAEAQANETRRNRAREYVWRRKAA